MKELAKSLIPAAYLATVKRVVQGFRHMWSQERYLWETIADPSLCGAAGQYPEARTALVELIRGNPRRLIDLGCGNGATASAAKARFPLTEVIGIEQNPATAQLAAERLDRVVTASVENIDYDAHGIPEGSIDAALLLDVLEHLYDPWDVLRRLHPRLAAGGQVIASIPNARNYWLLSQLLNDGNFSYAENGILDITHIRFFTRREIEKMFAETGYRITSMASNLDERVPETLPVLGDGGGGKFVLRNLTDDDVRELRTLQFYVVATPV